VCRRIREELSHEQQRQVAFICQDSFYRDLTDKEQVEAKRGDFNFDHPGNFL
jgi:uridine kinase